MGVFFDELGVTGSQLLTSIGGVVPADFCVPRFRMPAMYLPTREKIYRAKLLNTSSSASSGRLAQLV